MFHTYGALIGYYGINYVCVIDSRRKEYIFNEFFREHGDDTKGYTPDMIRNFLRDHDFTFHEFYWRDPGRPEELNMQMFGIWLSQVWSDKEGD